MRSTPVSRMGLSRLGLLAGLIGMICVAGPPPATAGSFAELEKEVVEFTLDNGLRFIVLERHVAPVFAYATFVNAGGADELPGNTGIAHMFEHMAFKGTETIGTTSYAEEQKVLDRMDDIWAQVLAERERGRDADSEKLAELEEAFRDAEEDAQKFVVSNEFSKILEEQGVQDLNAGTALDWTIYHYSLPSNRLELWAMMEADRLTHPVMREFYRERDVVIEERRMRYESSPTGRLMEAFLGLTFPAHPYGDGVIGYRADLENMHRSNALAFRKTYYVAPNITIAVVGDVTVKDVKALAKKYFSDVPVGPTPPRVGTIEPEQAGERRVTIEDPAQPFIFLGYHIPDVRDPDFTAYELLGMALGQGRSSRLYAELVKRRKIAAEIGAYAGWPAQKYPCLFLIYTMVSAGEDPHDVEAAIHEVIDDLKDHPITEEELAGTKIRAKADLIRQVRSNGGLTWALTTYDRLYGDWRKVFRIDEELEAVTVDDIKRIAERTFVKSNRNIAMIAHPSEES